MTTTWIGLDVHKGFTAVGGFDPATGEVMDLGQVPTDREHLIEALELLPEPKVVVLEAGRKSWAVAGWLEPYAQEVWVVDPGEVRILQRQRPKTDRRDAAALARLGATGQLEPLWRPDAADLNLRELTRGRIALVRTGTRLRNMIRALCARHGQELPRGDLLGETQQQRLSQVQLPAYARLSLQTFNELLAVVQALLERFAEPMEQEAATDVRAQRLMTIPGIGANLGLTIGVEIGQVTRFASPAHLRSYSGLCPQVHASGGRVQHGPLTKAGNRWLRWAMVMAAQHIANSRRGCDSRLKRLHMRTAFRHGRNPAKVACARGLLDLIYHLETHQEDWQPPRDEAA